MPSGKTHDIITIALTPPVFALTFLLTEAVEAAAFVTVAFVFGGLMFGPDLDTISKQYTRWSIFRILWYPYRSFLAHRSRWSHGLIFGTLFRVVYFFGVISLIVFLGALAISVYSGGVLPDVSGFSAAWQPIGEAVRNSFGDKFLPSVFLGMWTGAASHTFTDMAVSYVKTGRVTEFL